VQWLFRCPLWGSNLGAPLAAIGPSRAIRGRTSTDSSRSISVGGKRRWLCGRTNGQANVRTTAGQCDGAYRTLLTTTSSYTRRTFTPKCVTCAPHHFNISRQTIKSQRIGRPECLLHGCSDCGPCVSRLGCWRRINGRALREGDFLRHRACLNQQRDRQRHRNTSPKARSCCRIQ
jgi:hypothetical protein